MACGFAVSPVPSSGSLGRVVTFNSDPQRLLLSRVPLKSRLCCTGDPGPRQPLSSRWPWRAAFPGWRLGTPCPSQLRFHCRGAGLTPGYNLTPVLHISFKYMLYLCLNFPKCLHIHSRVRRKGQYCLHCRAEGNQGPTGIELLENRTDQRG